MDILMSLPAAGLRWASLAVFVLAAIQAASAAPQPRGAASAAAAVGSGCPNFQSGVLAMHNNLRALHGALPLVWDNTLAAKAQAHADTCEWGHTPGRQVYPNGESIYSSPRGLVTYPFKGMDVCSWATYALYLEATSYNYDKPGTSRDPLVPIGHFVNIVWANTTKLGCGYTACSDMDYVVCWFAPGFYVAGSYKDNVKPPRCHVATGDGWCVACPGGTCSRCYERPAYGQPMGKHKILLDPATKRCVSKCPSKVKNCQRCDFADRCLKCKAGWAPDAQRRCTVRAAKTAQQRRRRQA